MYICRWFGVFSNSKKQPLFLQGKQFIGLFFDSASIHRKIQQNKKPCHFRLYSTGLKMIETNYSVRPLIDMRAVAFFESADRAGMHLKQD